jgi:hypothetical protein
MLFPLARGLSVRKEANGKTLLPLLYARGAWGTKGVSAILDRKTRFMPALRRFRGQMSRSFPPIAERLQATAATVSASRLARCCCEMSASASRRDNTDRSLARSAWESVPRKNRPVGYGMVGRS